MVKVGYLKAMAVAVPFAIYPIAVSISVSRSTPTAPELPAIPVTHCHTAKVDGVDIVYREAGPAEAPVILLLHGFPTSYHMFRDLIPTLGDRYHVIAPDYPGLGESDASPDLHDLPGAQRHVPNTGHFALEDKTDEMVPVVLDFLKQKFARS